jgi:hypothetical protein
MKKVIALTAGLLWLLQLPATAQSNFDEDSCSSALDAAEAQLIGDRDIWLTNFHAFNAAEGYSNPPYDRLQIVSWTMAGDDTTTANIMNSPQLLTSVARTVINGCPQVGLVEVGVNETDWYTAFGIVGNQIREFECIDQTDSMVRWGYRICL